MDDQENNNKAATKTELGNLEQNNQDPEYSSGDDTSFRYTKGDSKSGRFFNRGGKTKTKGLLAHKKGLLIFGSIAGLGIGVMIWLVIFLFGALLIPQLAQHIAEYQFVRVTSQFADDAQRVSEEKLALDTIPDDAAGNSALAALKDKYGTLSDQASTLWSSLDAYRPSKVIANLGTNGQGLKLNYTTKGLLGRQVLSSVELDGETYLVKSQGLTRFIPVLGNIIDWHNDFTFSRDFAPALSGALEDDSVGTIVRTAVAAKIRSQLDIGLVAWTAGRLADYFGKDPTDARSLVSEDITKVVDGNLTPQTPVTEPLKDAEASGEAILAADEATPAGVAKIVANDGTDPAAQAAIDSALVGSGLKTVLGVINPLYNIAMPVCIIYDGSLDNSSGTIDNATTQQQRAFYFVESAADQEKTGSPAVNAEAVGALNSDLNSNDNIGLSNPEVRANGGTVNTSNMVSTESSADGQTTILSATLGSLNIPGAAAIADTIDSVAGPLCPKITSLTGSITLGLINLGVGILSGGTATAAQEAAGTAADELIGLTSEQIEETLASQLGDTLLANGVTEAASSAAAAVAKPTLVSRAADLIFGTAKTAGQIAGMTVIAKLIVLSKSAQLNSGTSQNLDLANEADSGGNLQANELSRQLNYGRPLNQAEVVQSNESDQQIQANNVSKESTYQRYFAIDNADSLFSKIGFSVYADLNGSIFSNLLSKLGSIFDPISAISKIFSSTDKSVALAQGTVDNTDYGNVQFGWSQSEENLINSSSTYMPLENQLVLDNSGEETVIANLYGHCFTYTIGQLLSEALIVRDSDGNVIDNPSLSSAICSPIYLGPKNPKYGDLVFRWRLAMSYTNTVNQYDSETSLGS
jgi:hypothetical protein